MLALPLSAQPVGVFIDDALVADVSYGLNCSVEIVGSLDAPGTDRGSVDLFEEAPVIAPEGQIVPALPGLGFGVRARSADGQGRIDATFRVTHPPFTPSGTRQQSWDATFVEASPSTHLYRFDFPHEMVPGAWVMEARREGRTLYRITFTVVPASQYPGADELCAGPETIIGRIRSSSPAASRNRKTATRTGPVARG